MNPPTVAILIPCYNEEASIAKVLADFRRELPDAKLYVFDNASTDDTAGRALAGGAIVARVHRRGKGNVIRAMFRDVDADVYVMVDGDDTYPAKQVHALMAPVLDGRADMVVGARLARAEEGSFRRLHRFGNRLVRRTINLLFGSELRDVLSGYRCFSSRFVKSVPIMSHGFEVETELTLHALDKGFNVREVPVDYTPRGAGSVSKLRTFHDGALVLRTIFSIFKDYHPLKAFGSIGIVSLVAGIGLGTIPVREFLATAQVTHASTAVLATGLVLTSLLCFATGFVLDTVNRHYREQYRLLGDALGRREERVARDSLRAA